MCAPADLVTAAAGPDKLSVPRIPSWRRPRDLVFALETFPCY